MRNHPSKIEQGGPGWALVLCTLGAIGCQDPPAGDEEGVDEVGETDADSDEGGETRQATYWQDVAPIYFERCVTCHREGGMAPFALDEYESAASWAEVSAHAVERGEMPPWLVRDDGSCNDWRDSRALEPAEIDTILGWVDEGAPEGEPRDDLAVPETPSLAEGTPFSTPQFTPAPAGGIFAQFDEYRCFLSDPQLEQDMFITGYDVHPGNEALVHHVLMASVDPEREVGEGLTNLDVMQALDDASPDRLGWDCFGIAGEGVVQDSLPITWAPGQGVVEFPDESGVRVPAGSLLVTQVHYNMADPGVLGQSDSTTVNVRLEPEVEREGLFDLPAGLLATYLEGEPQALEPGEEQVDFRWTFPTDEYIGWQGAEELELWGFFPHMHERGTSMSVRLLDGEGRELGCLAEVPDWDFGWQLWYFYREPIVLSAGQQVEVTCSYDTRTELEPIWPGWGTQNEMCLSGLYLIPR